MPASSTPEMEAKTRAGLAADMAELLRAAAQPLGRAQGEWDRRSACVCLTVQPGHVCPYLLLEGGAWGSGVW